MGSAGRRRIGDVSEAEPASLIPPKPAGATRLVAWNANSGVHKKLSALLALDPDVAVVSECANPEVLRAKAGLSMAGGSMVWVGEYASKGLAVLGFNGHTVATDPSYDARLQWVLPVVIDGAIPFQLLAVWAMGYRASVQHPDSAGRTQPRQAIELYRSFIGRAPTVVAGDFNDGTFWDAKRPRAHPITFASTVAAFEQAGLRSGWHHANSAGWDADQAPTLYFTRARDKPYHIDYVWLPQVWLDRLAGFHLGSYEAWVAKSASAGLSDHVPLIVDLWLGGERIPEHADQA